MLRLRPEKGVRFWPLCGNGGAFLCFYSLTHLKAVNIVKLPHEEIVKFQKLYKECFGIDLPLEQAEETANDLFQLCAFAHGYKIVD